MGERADDHEGIPCVNILQTSLITVSRQGYLNNPTATAEAITPDGWFKTGDICVRDKDGFFTIVDRRKELIKYKASFLLRCRIPLSFLIWSRT